MKPIWHLFLSYDDPIMINLHSIVAYRPNEIQSDLKTRLILSGGTHLFVNKDFNQVSELMIEYGLYVPRETPSTVE